MNSIKELSINEIEQSNKQHIKIILYLVSFLVFSVFLGVILKPIVSFFSLAVVTTGLLFILLILLSKKYKSIKIKKYFSFNFKKWFSLPISICLGICFAFIIYSVNAEARVYLDKVSDEMTALNIILFFIGSFFSLNGIALVAIAVVEELYFRGVFLENFDKLVKKPICSIILTVLVFSIFHSESLWSGEYTTFLVIIVMQFLITLLYRKLNNNMLFSIGWHYAYDAFILLIFGMASKS